MIHRKDIPIEVHWLAQAPVSMDHFQQWFHLRWVHGRSGRTIFGDMVFRYPFVSEKAVSDPSFTFRFRGSPAEADAVVRSIFRYFARRHVTPLVTANNKHYCGVQSA